MLNNAQFQNDPLTYLRQQMNREESIHFLTMLHASSSSHENAALAAYLITRWLKDPTGENASEMDLFFRWENESEEERTYAVEQDIWDLVSIWRYNYKKCRNIVKADWAAFEEAYGHVIADNVVPEDLQHFAVILENSDFVEDPISFLRDMDRDEIEKFVDLCAALNGMDEHDAAVFADAALTWLETPGVYADSDTGLVCVSDHVSAWFGDGKLTIEKAPLTITANDQSYVYNGQTQGEGDPTYDDPAVIAEKVTVEGLQSPDQLANVTLSGSAKAVGEYPIEVTGYRIEDSAGNNVAENYIVTTVPGKLTIKENKQVAKTSGTPLTTMKAGDTSMTIAWQKVTGAEGYDIFFSRCDGKGKTTAKKAQTINGNSTFAWTRSGLTAGVSYKAYVKAYVMNNGSKQYVAASPLMHAYTKGYTKRYTNAKSVKVKKTKVSIKKGKTFKIKAKVKKLKKGKKLMPTKHELKLRYLSTDSSIATVSKKGKIKGVKAGTCYVYAYAHNGVFKKIKVTVK